MKVVLFCGGLGTRLREYSETIPKPLATIGYRPILWHLMKYYAHHGHTDFILCLGYRGDLIKEFFLNYNECMSNDFVLSEGGKKITLHKSDIDNWRITFVDTGLNSNVGTRLKAVERHLEGEEMFLANYSDGLSDFPLAPHVDQFKNTPKAIGSFITVRPSQSFHGVHVDDQGYVDGIQHVRKTDYWINGGFFIFRREIFDYMKAGEEMVEEPFQRLIAERRLLSRHYEGFWAAMETFKDKINFDNMYARGETPWAVWKA
jgi:glucose-1-phosphate cytidylyltransferase